MTYLGAPPDMKPLSLHTQFISPYKENGIQILSRSGVTKNFFPIIYNMGTEIR